MVRRIDIEPTRSLSEQAAYAELVAGVEALRREARSFTRKFRDRTIWMVNSTARGGGVSEMLPGIVTHLRELGIHTEWAVIASGDESFFHLTKRIHNLIHGDGEPGLGVGDRLLFEQINRHNAERLRENVRDGDVLIVHDPQPMPIAAMLREHVDLTTIWRCHIGLDSENAATRDAWQFLEPYAAAYDHAVFSAPDYVTPYFEARSTIIYPALDPLTPKNRPLAVKAVVEVLGRAGLMEHPAAPFDEQVRRVQPDGTWQSALRPDDPGLLTRPIVTQVSRWDRLKGFLPLMRGFADLRRSTADGAVGNARLILAGPDPDFIADDPEGREVLEELRQLYLTCDPAVRRDVLILALPMHDAETNALIVNALQQVSTVVVQNSLREGFGLTITEAMWKAVPVLSNTKACGPRQQIRDGVEGVMIRDPEDTHAIADALRTVLADGRTEEWGRNARRRVHERFLVHTQLQHWVRLLDTLTTAARQA